MTSQFQDCIIPADSQISAGVAIGPRVVLAGEGIVVREKATIDAAAVIGAGVTIGRGAWVRAGAVVLRSVPANAIVEGNPAQVVGYLDGEGAASRPDPKHIDVHGFAHLPRPSKVDLGVGGSALYLMRRIVDARGASARTPAPERISTRPRRSAAANMALRTLFFDGGNQPTTACPQSIVGKGAVQRSLPRHSGRLAETAKQRFGERDPT